MRQNYFKTVKTCTNDQLLLLSLFANVSVLATIESELDRRATQDLSYDFYVRRILGGSAIYKTVQLTV